MVATTAFHQTADAQTWLVEKIIDDGHFDRVIVAHEEWFQLTQFGGEGVERFAKERIVDGLRSPVKDTSRAVTIPL